MNSNRNSHSQFHMNSSQIGILTWSIAANLKDSKYWSMDYFISGDKELILANESYSNTQFLLLVIHSALTLKEMVVSHLPIN